MKKFFLGQNPLTTLTGYLVAILTAIYQTERAGIHNWQDYLLSVAIALFGRFAADEQNSDRQPPLAGVQTNTSTASFFRRGKRYEQRRNRWGQFTCAYR